MARTSRFGRGAALAAWIAAALSPCACSSAGAGGAVYRHPGDGEGPSEAAARNAELPLGAVPIELSRGAPARPDDAAQRTRRRVREDETFFEEKIETAKAYSLEGDDETALAVIGAALALEPSPPLEERLRALRAEIKARHVETEVLRVDARGVRDFVPFDTDVDFVVRLRNVGATDVVIRAPGTGSEASTTGTALVLAVTRRDRDIYAATLVRSWRQVLPLLSPGAEPLVIPPASSHEITVRVPADDAGPPISGLRHIEVGGEVRADRIECGVVEPFGRLRIRPGRVVVLPGGYEPLAADPVASIRKASDLSMPIHLLVASEFVRAADRPAAVEALAEVLATGREEVRTSALNALSSIRAASVGEPLRPLATPLLRALSAHPERAAALMDGLRTLSGVSLAPDARLWEDWGRRLEAGTGSPVLPEEKMARPR